MIKIVGDFEVYRPINIATSCITNLAPRTAKRDWIGTAVTNVCALYIMRFSINRVCRVIFSDAGVRSPRRWRAVVTVIALTRYVQLASNDKLSYINKVVV